MLYELSKNHYKDLLREAKEERLANYTHPWVRKSMLYLANLFLRHGKKIRKKYDIEPSHILLCCVKDNVSIWKLMPMRGKAGSYSTRLLDSFDLAR